MQLATNRKGPATTAPATKEPSKLARHARRSYLIDIKPAPNGRHIATSDPFGVKAISHDKEVAFELCELRTRARIQWWDDNGVLAKKLERFGLLNDDDSNAAEHALALLKERFGPHDFEDEEPTTERPTPAYRSSCSL